MDTRAQTNIIKQMRGEQWRQQDVGVFDEDVRTLIWYGPGGVEGDCASELEDEGGFWQFSSYQRVDGYFDEYDKDFPFLKTTVSFDTVSLKDALKLLCISTKLDRLGLALYAADYGQAALAYYGSREEMVEDLPR